MKFHTFNLKFLLSLPLAAFLVTGCQKDDHACERSNSTSNTNDAEITNLAQYNDGEAIPGQYIVVYKETFLQEVKAQFKKELSKPELNDIIRNESLKILSENNVPSASMTYSYGASIAGFAGKFSESELIKLKADPKVAYIEQDRIISLGKPSSGGSTSTGESVPWGISRVVTDVTASYTNSNGNVVWIIDTGVDMDHPDLNVDATRCVSYISNSSPDDQNGHGTHVAGTIGAKRNNNIGVVGVAPGCTVIGVRVLGANGSGTNSGVIAGINHVATYGQDGDVANMSLGGSASKAIDDAVLNASYSSATGKRIFFAVAAGNDGANAANYSPARQNGTYIFTVSAMNNSDVFASFSNYGTPVDYCAPGVNVYSTYKGGSYATLSGTSMATPHVAGLLLRTGGNLNTSGTVKNDKDNVPDPIAHD